MLKIIGIKKLFKFFYENFLLLKLKISHLTFMCLFGIFFLFSSSDSTAILLRKQKKIHHKISNDKILYSF